MCPACVVDTHTLSSSGGGMEEGGGGGRESGGMSSPEELMGPVNSGFREERTVLKYGDGV